VEVEGGQETVFISQTYGKTISIAERFVRSSITVLLL
jgi:hypothetical protein